MSTELSSLTDNAPQVSQTVVTPSPSPTGRPSAPRTTGGTGSPPAAGGVTADLRLNTPESGPSTRSFSEWALVRHSNQPYHRSGDGYNATPDSKKPPTSRLHRWSFIYLEVPSASASLGPNDWRLNVATSTRQSANPRSWITGRQFDSHLSQSPRRLGPKLPPFR